MAVLAKPILFNCSAGVTTLMQFTPAPRLPACMRWPRRSGTFNLRRDDFLAVIDGMEMDVIAPIRAPDWATLDLYCDRVASAVGRLCVRVFGMADAQGVALAHHLGRALQLTNILRDIDEDAAVGRLYLPQEALRAAGIASSEPLDAIANPAIDQACAPVVARARRHFVESDAIIAESPRRVVRTARIMSAAYRSILEHLVARGGFRRARRSNGAARNSFGSFCVTASCDAASNPRRRRRIGGAVSRRAVGVSRLGGHCS